jgi:catechol 2,3-dioxygenase-like lactoylglutathione lyase family enzyme
MSEESKLGERAARCSHWGITVSTEEKARDLFGTLFHMPVVKAFDVDESLSRALFDLESKVKAIVFDAGGTQIEVFIDPDGAGRAKRYDHLCLSVKNREDLVKRAEAMGMEIKRYMKGDREIVFLRDTDGNLYEIKALES